MTQTHTSQKKAQAQARRFTHTLHVNCLEFSSDRLITHCIGNIKVQLSLYVDTCGLTICRHMWFPVPL